MAEKVDLYIELTKDAYNKRDFQDVLTYSTKALQENVQNPEAWFYAGTASATLLCIKDTKKAINDLKDCWGNALSQSKTAPLREALAKLMQFEYRFLLKNVVTTVVAQAGKEVGAGTDYYSTDLHFKLLGDFYREMLSVPTSLMLKYLLSPRIDKDEQPLPDFPIGEAKLTYEEWESATPLFFSKIETLKARASATQAFHNRYIEMSNAMIIPSYAVLCLEPEDKIRAYQKLLDALDNMKQTMTSRFGSYFGDTSDKLRNNLRNDIKKAKADSYWKTHEEEKKALEEERDGVGEQFDALDNAVDEAQKAYDAIIEERDQACPEEKELDSKKAEIQGMEKEKNSLGLFKGKQKKELQSRIDEATSALSPYEEKAAEGRRKRNEAYADRVKAAEEKLNAATQAKDKAYARYQEIEDTLQNPVD